MQLFIKLQFCAAILLWQEVEGPFRRIWRYINQSFTFGRIEVSLATLVQGLVILALAIMISRWLSAILERRIARRANIDPGIAYTIGRLTKYVVTTLGVMLFLQI